MAEKITLTFLGTGGSIPSRTTNHPAFLITYKSEGILVDCGEGTQRQFRKAGLNPGKITKLLITHWHGDHILGIPGILQTLAFSDYSKILEIYGPIGTKKYMKEMMKTFVFSGKIKFKVYEIIKEGTFFSGEDFYLEAEKMTHRCPCLAYNFILNGKIRIDKGKLKKLGIASGPHLADLKIGKNIKYKEKIYSAKNLIYTEPGKKISIVMDTTINPKISAFTKDADVLVIESSYDEKSVDLAREHKHMTSKQAAEIAKKAKVQKLVLTHISQRYSKDPKQLQREAKKVFKKEVILPKDLDKLEI